MAAMAKVMYGLLVVINYIRHSYLAMLIYFDDFPAVVRSPLFSRGVVRKEALTSRNWHGAGFINNTNRVKAPVRNFKINFFSINIVGIQSSYSSFSREQNCKHREESFTGATSHKTIIVGDLRVCLNGRKTTVPGGCLDPTIPIQNQYGILPMVQQYKAEFQPHYVEASGDN